MTHSYRKKHEFPTSMLLQSRADLLGRRCGLRRTCVDLSLAADTKRRHRSFAGTLGQDALSDCHTVSHCALHT